jgi:transcriptional regulator with XRE-family HTH domain
MSVQIIEKNGKPEWAVLPYEEYQRLVAEAAGISKPYLSQLESGRRKGTTEVLQAIAKVLEVSLDDLVMSEEEA